jgi:hypothetical protein
MSYNRGKNWKKKDEILPKNKVSEHLFGGGLTSFQHSENNKFFQRVWELLKDGGYHLNPTTGMRLIKVESENGFRIQ